jgi:hypothetical protein
MLGTMQGNNDGISTDSFIFRARFSAYSLRNIMRSYEDALITEIQRQAYLLRGAAVCDRQDDTKSGDCQSEQ